MYKYGNKISNIIWEPHDAIHSSEPNYIYSVTLKVSRSSATENIFTGSEVLRILKTRQKRQARPEITISKVINWEAVWGEESLNLARVQR